MIDQETKNYLDYFEGVEEEIYSVKSLEIRDNKTGVLHNCYAYVIENFRPELIGENAVFFENYSSINQFYPEYKKCEDTPENSNHLYDSVKQN
mgnify:CR=1 FL=1